MVLTSWFAGSSPARGTMRDRKEYMKRYHAEWHQRNKDKHISQIRARQRELIEEYQDSKMKPCMDCGFIPTVPEQMEYDHRENKLGTVSQLIRRGSISKTKEEINKCDLVCANCHRLRTALRRKGIL